MTRRLTPCGSLALLLAAIVTVACQSDGGSPPAAEPAAPSVAASGDSGIPPSLGELANATYRGLEQPAGPVTLVDGRWEGKPVVPGGASRPVVTLVRDFRLTGDLDGDGADEAVVGLSQSSGGSGTYLYLAVLGRREGRPDNLATTLLGNRAQVRRASIEGGSLVVDLVQAGPQDAMCCPGELVRKTFALRGGNLEAAEPVSTGRLGLDTLGGMEWVLRRWAWDEPAPEEPEVTLRVEEGRFAGHNGCNRYFAPATAGDAPGDVALGPAGATKMFCPDPAGAVETRFMSQLQGVTKFGFTMGRLMLSYEVGGEHGAMLFDPRTPAGDPTP